MTDTWDDNTPLYRPNWRDRARRARAVRVPAWTDPHGLTHYRDAHGQIGHHRPADPKCPCNPTKEKP